MKKRTEVLWKLQTAFIVHEIVHRIHCHVYISGENKSTAINTNISASEWVHEASVCTTNAPAGHPTDAPGAGNSSLVGVPTVHTGRSKLSPRTKYSTDHVWPAGR